MTTRSLAMMIAVGSWLIVALGATASESRPNFILIFIDDLGYGDVGAFNPDCKNRTPNLDRMAREGMKLTSFYAAPVCTPSRAQVVTGCYAKRVSLPNVLFPGASVGLHPDEHTIAELLKAQGYATMCVGKWHLGDQPECLPTKHGFDHYFGVPYSNDMQFRQGSAKGKLALVRDNEVAEILSNAEQAKITARYTDEAVRFIDEHKDEPFFLYLPHTAVHVPLYPGEQFAGKSKNGSFGDWAEEVDGSVGRVLDKLRELKLEEKTLVVFTSDNGPWLSQGKNGGVAGPLRGGKGGTYEGGVREPTIAWWPKRIPADSTSNAVSGNIDFLPTFVSLAGSKVPSDRRIDGKDLSPVLLGQTKESPHEAWYYFSGTQLQAVRSGPWKLAIFRQNEGRGGPKEDDQDPFKPTLYNLDLDIGEKMNVIDKHPDVVERLQGLIAKMDADLGVTKIGPGVREPARFSDAKPLVADAASPATVVKALHELKLGETLATSAAPQIADKPFEISCEVEAKSASGVIVAHGGTAFGYSLHLADGKPCFTVRNSKTPVTIKGEKRSAGRFALSARLAKDGQMTLQVDGEVVARGQAGGLIPKQPQEDLSLGFDSGQPITEYIGDSKFRGSVEKLQILPLHAVGLARADEPLAFSVQAQPVFKQLSPESCWFHPRVAPLPRFGKGDGPAVIMMIQKHLSADDHYSGMYYLRTDDLGQSWTEPTAIPELDWQKREDDETIAVCDVTPGWHSRSGKMIAIGTKLRYSRQGAQLLDKPRSNECAYATFDPTTKKKWSTWKMLEMPETDGKFFLVAPGCVQWLEKEDGTLLIPVYFKGKAGSDYVVTVLHCSFDGQVLKYREHGDELAISGGRGFVEPSLALYQNKYYLTLRNDSAAYVTTSADGLHFKPVVKWTFDDGQDLGSYNTQAHWLVHSGGLFLTYTRRGANNDHIARNRAPLFIAQVDQEKLQVIRKSEQALLPERGVMLGNFGTAAITPHESWVTDAEFILGSKPHPKGADGTIWLGRVKWAAPNQLLK